MALVEVAWPVPSITNYEHEHEHEGRKEGTDAQDGDWRRDATSVDYEYDYEHEGRRS